MNIVFMGTPDFAVSVVDAVSKEHNIVLIVTQPDKPKGRGEQMSFPPVKEWAIEHNIPVFQPNRIRDTESIEELRKYDAQLFLVAAFGQILPKEILDMPEFGCVNVHASLLPEYRGAAPIQWAVIDGKEITGVTTMQMGIGLDDGDMLLKKEIRLAEDETGGSLFDKLAVLGGELAVETIDALIKGQVTPVPQDETRATHVGMIKKSLGKIDFSNSATSIERLIRGLNPWPSAFASLGGKSVKLWKSRVCEGNEGKTPGEVIFAGKDGIRISCGTDSILVTELQLEGKKRMNADDFLRGHKLLPGDIFI